MSNILTGVTVRNAESGFYLNGIFDGMTYFVSPFGSGVVRLYPANVSDEVNEMQIDLASLILQDTGGSPVTPANLQERSAMLNTFVSKKKLASGGSGGRQVFLPTQSPFANVAARNTWATANLSDLHNDATEVTRAVVGGTTYEWNGEDTPSSYDANGWAAISQMADLSLVVKCSGPHTLTADQVANGVTLPAGAGAGVIQVFREGVVIYNYTVTGNVLSGPTPTDWAVGQELLIYYK